MSEMPASAETLPEQGRGTWTGQSRRASWRAGCWEGCLQGKAVTCEESGNGVSSSSPVASWVYGHGVLSLEFSKVQDSMDQAKTGVWVVTLTGDYEFALPLA